MPPTYVDTSSGDRRTAARGGPGGGWNRCPGQPREEVVMDVHLVVDDKIKSYRPEDVPALLDRDEGIVWVDIPDFDDAAARLLTDAFGVHPLAVRDCQQRNRIAKIHAYPDHVF